MRRHGFNRHLRRKKSKGSIRNLKRNVTISGFLEKKIRNILGV
jgi:ribosomal protein L35